MSEQEARQWLHQRIIDTVFVRGTEEPIASRKGGPLKHTGWLFDFRRIFLDPDALNVIATLFWKHRPPQLQIGGIESAAIPLVTGLVIHAQEFGNKASGFYIRKSRKKDGLMHAIEGHVKTGTPIILVDDLVNSGQSFIRQVELLEQAGHRVSRVWTILRYRDPAYYEYFTKKSIVLESVFSLEDFTQSLDVHLLEDREPVRPVSVLEPEWKFSSPNPNHSYVVAKSAPTLDETRVYVGSDAGYMWALHQKDGSAAWSYKVGYHAKGKSIFSTPAVYNDSLFFGSYDGNVYCLNTENGKKRWMYVDADWVGSSPVVATDSDTLFIGLEFGLLRKRGGIAALDVRTGKPRWTYTLQSLTHATPRYLAAHKQVVIGSNDGIVYLFDARSGALVWTYKTGTATEEELDAGFSAYDIKAAVAYDEARDQIVCANMNGDVIGIDRTSGRERFRFKMEFGSYATPCIYKNSAIVSSLDKHIYCIDLEHGAEQWKFNTHARVFCEPICIENIVIVGTNAGALYALNPHTGATISHYILTERITNRVAYNPDTKRLFVPTNANELYCFAWDPQSLSTTTSVRPVAQELL